MQPNGLSTMALSNYNLQILFFFNISRICFASNISFVCWVEAILAANVILNKYTLLQSWSHTWINMICVMWPNPIHTNTQLCLKVVMSAFCKKMYRKSIALLVVSTLTFLEWSESILLLTLFLLNKVTLFFCPNLRHYRFSGLKKSLNLSPEPWKECKGTPLFNFCTGSMLSNRQKHISPLATFPKNTWTLWRIKN